jgi:NAD(P)-dependent dehydrogenase (short-subunit alcohol dehydrogenase family)
MLIDQRIIVIGGSSGIGLAVAKAAEDAGADVQWCHSRTPINLPPAFVSFDRHPAARPALNRRHASTVGFALLRDLNPSLPRDRRTYATTPSVSACRLKLR